jgi:hypothetical protein
MKSTLFRLVKLFKNGNIELNNFTSAIHIKIGNGGWLTYCRRPMLLLMFSVFFCLIGLDQNVRAKIK